MQEKKPQPQPQQKKAQVQKAIRVEPKGKKTVYVYDKRVSFEVDSIYRINEIIGRGVYGVVAEGENTVSGQKVAVKLIK